MVRTNKRLGARAVESIREAGMHADGDGLYLFVDQSGRKRWTFIFQWDGKRKELGLGPLPSVSLADARQKAAAARKLVADGTNPIVARRSTKQAREAGEVTFGTFADALVDTYSTQFRNEKHIAQWRMTLRDYAAPLRSLRLDEVDTAAVLSVLTPCWGSKPETASRLRGRIEKVLDAAKVKGLRNGENPARWRGHLDHLLPKRQRLARGHHAAMPYADVGSWTPAKTRRVDGLIVIH